MLLINATLQPTDSRMIFFKYIFESRYLKNKHKNRSMWALITLRSEIWWTFRGMNIAEYVELIQSGENHKQDICDEQNDAISEKTVGMVLYNVHFIVWTSLVFFNLLNEHLSTV